MIAKKKPNPYALDVTRFVDSPSHALAVLVHRETEALRTSEAQAFKAKHGDIRPSTNAFLWPPELFDSSKTRDWGDYAKSFDVLERCCAELGVPLGGVAKRIALELRPENWEVMFWMGTWLNALDHAADIKAQLYEQTQAIEQAKKKQSQVAINRANQKHKHHAKAKAFVLEEWTLHKNAYEGNRTAFATAYVRRIWHEMGIKVALKTVSVNWLGTL